LLPKNHVNAVNIFASASLSATGVIFSQSSISANGNVSGGNISTAGTVFGNNISATGTVSGGNISATGNVSGSGIRATGTLSGGNITTAGTVSAVSISASGSISAVGSVNASQITSTSLVATNNLSSNILYVGATVDTAGMVNGEIRAENNITAYATSDIKFKENIANVSNALSTVIAIGAKTFDWKDDYIKSRGGEDGYFIQKHDFGVIAQDVEKAFPKAVRLRPADGSLAVDYEKLSVLAFAAIAEMKTAYDQQIAELKSEIQALKGKM
jgi:hypothetical protein